MIENIEKKEFNNKVVPWRMEYTNHKTLKHFCEKYHYSKTCPASVYRYVFYENDKQVGIISFGNGTNRFIGRPFNLEQNQVLELTRVAFKEHSNYLSVYLSNAIKDIKKRDKKILLIISYSDLRQSHYGTLYKANSFIFDSERKLYGIEVLKEGKWTHQKGYSEGFKQYKRDNPNIKISLKEYCSNVLGLEIRKQSNKYRWVKVINKKYKKIFEKRKK